MFRSFLSERNRAQETIDAPGYGSGLCHFFMGPCGVYYMTLALDGDVPWGAACYLAGIAHPFTASTIIGPWQPCGVGASSRLQ